MIVKYKISLTNRQIEELAKYCLQMSQLAWGTLVFQLFTSGKLIFVIWGLTIAVSLFILGMRLFKQVE